MSKLTTHVVWQDYNLLVSTHVKKQNNSNTNIFYKSKIVKKEMKWIAKNCRKASHLSVLDFAVRHPTLTGKNISRLPQKTQNAFHTLPHKKILTEISNSFCFLHYPPQPLAQEASETENIRSCQGQDSLTTTDSNSVKIRNKTYLDLTSQSLLLTNLHARHGWISRVTWIGMINFLGRHYQILTEDGGDYKTIWGIYLTRQNLTYNFWTTL